jgi:hypothetical protein
LEISSSRCGRFVSMYPMSLKVVGLPPGPQIKMGVFVYF